MRQQVIKTDDGWRALLTPDLYGRALFLSGKEPEAERILSEAVATSPVSTEAFGFLADAAERLGHTGVARDALVNLDVLEGDTAVAAARLDRAI